MERYFHGTLGIKWKVKQGERLNISTCRIEVKCLSNEDESQVPEFFIQTKISPSSEDIMLHEFVNLRPGNVYRILLQCLWWNDNTISKPVELFQMTHVSSPPVNFQSEVVEKRPVKLS